MVNAALLALLAPHLRHRPRRYVWESEEFGKSKEIKKTFIGDAATSSSAEAELPDMGPREMAEIATNI